MNVARIFPYTLAALLAVTAFTDRADAAAMIKITESGGNVIATGTGSLNTTGLTLLATSSSGAGVHSAASFLEISTGPTDLYQSISGPASFGTAGYTSPSSGSGDRFGIRFGVDSLAVPAGYVSGAPLAGTSNFTGKTFTQLGLIPGTYTWTWGSGANADSLTLKIEDSAIPVQAIVEIDANQNPSLRWQAELGRSYSISYSTDLITYVSIAKGFPFGGATVPTLTYVDLPILTGTTPKAFYRVEREPLILSRSPAELAAFFTANGGSAGFTDNQVKALETVMFALDEIEAGQLVAARTRVDAMLAAYPLSTSGWNNGSGYLGLNVGNPAGYYAIRMLDQILTLGNPSRAGKLRMTAVVAPTAAVTRPTLPLLALETVQLDIAPEILANDARRLHLATRLFRRWLQAITGGLHVELVVHVMDQGTTVDFNNFAEYFVSHPRGREMVASVPASIANTTDFWWVIAPSGVPGNGAGFGKDFVTGGMSFHTDGAPLFLSDDAWFTRKPFHLGTGPYSEVELGMYHPQWFQHEFMHHLYRTWPNFGLETRGHQWFTRSNWPADFVGINEPDYYAESLTKRLLTATPSLASVLQLPDSANMADFPVEMLVGTYQRNPYENNYHDVTITLVDGNLRWTNAAGVSWGLEVIGEKLWRTAQSPYGAEALRVDIDTEGNVTALVNSAEPYLRITPSAKVMTANLKTNLTSQVPLSPHHSPRFLKALHATDQTGAGCNTSSHHCCSSCFGIIPK